MFISIMFITNGQDILKLNLPKGVHMQLLKMLFDVNSFTSHTVYYRLTKKRLPLMRLTDITGRWVNMKVIAENDLILIIYKDKRYLKRVQIDKSFHGKGGIINFTDLAGMPFGIRYGQYEIYEPSVEDIVMYGIKRETQIVFPKDASFICFRLALIHGSRILEIGTGSGALTFIFSCFAGPGGSVVSFEKEERHYKNAKKNIEHFSKWNNSELHCGDVMEYENGGFDAVFIDVREPWLYLDKASELLKNSGILGMIVPTANQITDILKELNNRFGDIEVLEIMLRRYKTVAERVRPVDRMVAHTGYLVFARKIEDVPEIASYEKKPVNE
jgi:tRNA (adenine57-N1/adenine58-N1)-methyltransferase catalytic subunit